MERLNDIAIDMRLAMRGLLRSPGFAAVAIVSLALGIGANTAIFSIINAILLRSLPAANPSELRILNWTGTNVSLNHFEGSGWTENGRYHGEAFPHATFDDFRKRAAGVADIFCFFPLYNATAQTGGEAGLSSALMVSGNFFNALGSRTLIGRSLTPSDDRSDAEPAAVITSRLWQLRFGSNHDALGRKIAINRHEFTIVGVLPGNFASPLAGDPIDIYVPMAAQPDLKPSRPLGSYNDWWVAVMARLAPGADDARLHALLKPAFEETLKQSSTRAEKPDVLLAEGRAGIVLGRRFVAPSLYALQGIVAAVLLIACANLAGLLLTRAAGRRREFAICAAVGAGRWRLMRRLFIESLLLAIGGAGAGLLFGFWIKDFLMRFMPDLGYELRFDTGVDQRVLLFLLATTIATALLCGLLPALRASRADLAADLQNGRTGGGARHRIGRRLAIAQVAFSLLLVAAAGLFARSLANLRAVDPGFDSKNLLLFSVDADQAGLSERQRLDFFQNVREGLTRIPGVTAATASDQRLLSGYMSSEGISIPGREKTPGERMEAYRLVIGDDFFGTLRIPIRQGRSFGPNDTGASEKVAIVNQRLVQKYFRDQDPVGRTFGAGGTVYRIVGVCGSSLYADVRGGVPATMYLPASQRIPRAMNFAVRSALPPAELVPAARKAVASVSASIPVANISTQEAQIDGSLAIDRTFASLCGWLAGLAVLLCCIGIYGLMAYGVAQRTAEIGVRMALGAMPGDVTRVILREAMTTACWGLGAGLPLVLGLGLIARGAFFGVAPYDPLTVAGSVFGLLAAAALAGWLPARRAAKVDPMTALRAE